ncbi:voltage-gated chloride channel family protein [Flavobacterium franklandianum]|uniref:voltage-gated chloride channel family protein n=1 Tax=Flavobacterium franklandianum TaxID=2594430 RepID=UPI00117A4972|nr:voltage-gated chloride channel family protein [Flavobacterium franklandianum]TRX21839.1 voltage-gated chloride channel family protein [Flavobacterium franklandianum]
MNLKKTSLLITKWIFICLLIGIFSGCASAFFLVSLEWVTQYREHHNWIIWLLPIGGLCIGLLYHFYGTDVIKGNNVLLEEYENPKKTIPLKMAPMVLIGTLITHLFGGSAGREGTAVQMSGAIADQFTGLFKLNNSDRKTLIILGISAGFASVFGTPLAGALFALEVLYFSKITYRSIVLSFLTAYVAYFTVEFWQVAHTHYHIPIVPQITVTILGWIIIVSIIFGFASMLFSRSTHFWGKLFSKTIAFPPLRPLIGGLILAVAIYCIGTTKYIGLGIPTIVESFSATNPWYDFILKIVFTGFTLGAGFKGGEVTPLFFIGATLGSALSTIVPLPVALLAGMGFVAVFSGATHTPIACTVMGMELFGIESGLFIGIACVVAYYSSGSVGIYNSQIVKGSKYKLYQRFKRKDLEDF